MHIYTTDNNTGESLSRLTENTKQAYDDLQPYANKPLAQLLKQNPSLLIFSNDVATNKGGNHPLPLYELSGDAKLPDGCKLTTGNLMGFIGSGKTILSIKSRFSQIYSPDFFLHYMLCKVFQINVLDLSSSVEQDKTLDIATLLLPQYLKKAIAQGIFRAYKIFHRNDDRIKGAINVHRYIKQNVPFRGDVSYNSRERSYDNDMTQLVRHTIEYVQNTALGKNVLSIDKETKDAVEQFIFATPSYSISMRSRIISKNAKTFTHPYYSEYSTLQKLCLMILRHDGFRYYENKNQLYGIIFDGA